MKMTLTTVFEFVFVGKVVLIKNSSNLLVTFKKNFLKKFEAILCLEVSERISWAAVNVSFEWGALNKQPPIGRAG